MNSTLIANSRPRILHNQVCHITRSLSGNGTFLVSVGQEVTPSDVIGKFDLPSGFFTVNLAKKLSVSPVEAGKLIAKPIGSRIYKGELLATKTNILSKTDLTSPTDGTISDYNSQTGQLSLKFLSKSVNLVSGVYGIVDHIDQQNGSIWIRTRASQIFGVVGVGKPRLGLLKIISSPSNVISSQDIKPEYSNHILVCGAKIDRDVVSHAIQIGTAGLITGGINWYDFSSFINQVDQKANIVSDPGIGLMVTEGFGPIALGDDISAVLSSSQEKFVYLDGLHRVLVIPDVTETVLDAIRKTTLPSKVVSTQPEKPSQISIGQSVRMIWPSMLGIIGRIVAIDQTPTILESGVASYLLTIETASRKIRVPFQNVEII